MGDVNIHNLQSKFPASVFYFRGTVAEIISNVVGFPHSFSQYLKVKT